ncbi:MAG TPA: carboxy-S-adenosyl-L-methionine synthase CmoA [Gammaproteobacteria bacterium]|nr:carboxy-S-adenosyl-L-methionine synthase CmoA [Gammaproteobacteria bacterium]
MTDSGKRDTLFELPREDLVDFAFDERVADVFPDMVRRSVPGYEQIVTLSGLLAAQYATPDSRLYDLGCSLGAVTLSMLRRTPASVCITAVDNSAAMVARCRAIMDREADGQRVTVTCADIADTPVDDAAFIAMNLTLQFIAPEKREALLRRLHQGLRDDGALLIAEKIRFEDPAEQAFNEELHAAFKAANGYSELEIAQKRNALERVLIPNTLDEHITRLHAAGFSSVLPWFRCFNFVALLARP